MSSVGLVGFPKEAPGFEIVNFNEIASEMCDCGPSSRAFRNKQGSMTAHWVEVRTNQKPHAHDAGEIYFIVSCGEGATMTLGDEVIEVTPLTIVKIQGGTWHCADPGSSGTPMMALVVIETGHDSPEAKMRFKE